MHAWKQVAYQALFGDLFCKLLPVKRNRFLFSSFFGQHYSDGPRAISERLHTLCPEAEIWWDFTDAGAHDTPSYVRIAERDKPKYFLIKATAAFHVTNVFQQSAYLSGNRRKDFLIRLHLRLENRRKQSVLTTWHGTPYKKMQGDQVGGTARPFVCNKPCYYLVGNAFEERVMMNVTQGKMIPLRFGSPRSVNICRADPAALSTRREKLGIAPDAHVILYAPTFRDSADGRGRDPDASGLSQLRSLDSERLRACFREAFGWEKLVLVCRFHNQVEQVVNWKEFGADGAVLSGNLLEDIADYYQLAELVITDYSSVMFDFMVTKKPVFLLCPDYENYRDRERGLYFTPEELPFPMAKSWEELEELVRSIDLAAYREDVERFMKKLVYYGDDQVLDRTAAFLIKGGESNPVG